MLKRVFSDQLSYADRVDRVLNKAQLEFGWCLIEFLHEADQMAAAKRVGILLEYNYEDLEVCDVLYSSSIYTDDIVRST